MEANSVSGYGSYNITTMNQTKTTSESLAKKLSSINDLMDPPVEAPEETSTKYKVKPPRQLKSTFKAKQEEKRRQLAEKKESADRTNAGKLESVIESKFRKWMMPTMMMS
jgi:hypothetical protein